jgi:hypothetical protein
MKRSTTATLALVAFAAGVLATYAWLRAPHPPADGDAATAGKERKVLYWHDPMVPGPRFDKPGKSPFMDMELVPVYEDETAGGAPIVSVRPEIVNSLGVRTHEVKRAPLARTTVSHGYLFRGATDGGFYAQVDIFDRDADWVRAGLPARLSFDAVPGESFAGRVSQLDPDTGIGARTVKAQVRVNNPDARLKSNMFAEVVIESPASTRLAVPREAVIRTGQRTAVVLSLGAGRFQPVEVVAGRELGEFVEIRRGLKEGDRVVISGQFLIDSEASLRASFTRLTPADGDKPAAPPEPGH